MKPQWRRVVRAFGVPRPPMSAMVTCGGVGGEAVEIVGVNGGDDAPPARLSNNDNEGRPRRITGSPAWAHPSNCPALRPCGCQRSRRPSTRSRRRARRRPLHWQRAGQRATPPPRSQLRVRERNSADLPCGDDPVLCERVGDKAFDGSWTRPPETR